MIFKRNTEYSSYGNPALLRSAEEREEKEKDKPAAKEENMPEQPVKDNTIKTCINIRDLKKLRIKLPEKKKRENSEYGNPALFRMIEEREAKEKEGSETSSVKASPKPEPPKPIPSKTEPAKPAPAIKQAPNKDIYGREIPVIRLPKKENPLGKIVFAGLVILPWILAVSFLFAMKNKTDDGEKIKAGSKAAAESIDADIEWSDTYRDVREEDGWYIYVPDISLVEEGDITVIFDDNTAIVEKKGCESLKKTGNEYEFTGCTGEFEIKIKSKKSDLKYGLK